MTQKIVIQVQLSSRKHKAKVMEIAAVLHGVTSIAISTGVEKDRLEVIGEGVDPVKLTSLIRKKVNRNANLVRVEQVKPKYDQEPKNQQASIALSQWSSSTPNYCPPQYYYYPPPVYTYETVYNPSPPACSIM